MGTRVRSIPLLAAFAVAPASIALYPAACAATTDAEPAGGGAGKGGAKAEAGADAADAPGGDAKPWPDAGPDGSDAAAGSAGDAAGDADAGPGTIKPPPVPTGPPPDGTTDTVLAVSVLRFGDTDKNGVKDPDAWKTLGYDLDGKVSDASSTDVCQPFTGASSASKLDGTGGIDNAFGRAVLPLILSFSNDFPTQVNTNIAGGGFTEMVKIAKLGSGATYFPVAASLYGGGKMASAPVWNGTDAWPVTSESVLGGDVNAPKIVFDKSYLVQQTWVSGGAGVVVLPFTIAGQPFELTVHAAVLSMKLAADHKSATDGVVAGVLDTEEFVKAVKKAAGSLNKTYCSGPVIDAILDQIRKTSDILKDGTQDSTKTCDGISIGLGFEAKAVQLGSVAPPVVPPPDPCP